MLSMVVDDREDAVSAGGPLARAVSARSPRLRLDLEPPKITRRQVACDRDRRQ